MAVYNKNGTQLNQIYDVDGEELNNAYDVDGSSVFSGGEVDYSNYSYTEKWASKSISNTQGFDIYDGKVFWVSKSGNSTVPANCYVWNLSDGSQALDTAYITVYSGHGNNLCFDAPKMYATSAYTPHVYVNDFTNSFVFSLNKTLYMNDGSIDCDACIDENNKTILWTLGHSAGTGTPGAPYYISKWNLNSLTDNGDDTYTPQKIQTVETAQPANSYYFQGCKSHDGYLWYANGYSGSGTGAYVYAVDPDTGEVAYTINCNTTAEPEGVAWVQESGEWVLYVGFQGMALRRYTFGN